MSSYTEHLAEDRRLVILRLLDAAPGYSANESVLHTGLGRYGHRVSRDQVRTDIAWLTEQGLVASEELPQAGGGAVVVATIRGRGQEAAQGLVTVPGVKRPAAR